MLVLSLPLSLGRLSPVEVAVTPGVRFGIAWLRRHRLLRTLVVVVAAVAAADSAWFAIFVLYVRQVLDLPPVWYGGLLATGAAGGLLGAAVADRLVRRSGHRQVLAWSLAVTAGAPVLLLASHETWAAATVVVVTSGSFAVLNVTAVSLRQRMVPAGLLGRVTGASRSLVYGASALGAVAGGWLAGSFGLGAPFVMSGLVALAATITWYVGSAQPSAGPA